jgi:hypothetical protein
MDFHEVAPEQKELGPTESTPQLAGGGLCKQELAFLNLWENCGQKFSQAPFSHPGRFCNKLKKRNLMAKEFGSSRAYVSSWIPAGAKT